MSLWDLFRERWAVLVGFALIMFLGATLFLPALSKAKMKSKNVEAMSRLKQIGVAVQIATAGNSGKLPVTLDALTNVLGSDRALTDSVSGRRFIYIAGGANLDGLQSNDVLAYSPEDKNGGTVLFADGSVQRVRHDEFSALTNRDQSSLALAENSPTRKLNGTPAALAAPAPAAAPPLAGALAGISGIANGEIAPSTGAVSGVITAPGEFAAATAHDLAAEKLPAAQNSTVFKFELTTNALQLEMNNSQRFVRTAAKQNPPVLESFVVRQNGNAISVVDRDGSVYNGTLLPMELTLSDNISRAKDADKSSVVQEAKQKNLGLVLNAQAAAQNYFFRVAGANRSLQQNVVFSGNLIELTNVTANTAQTFGGAGTTFQPGVAQNAQQQLFSNSRITGTVTIGATNQIEINAVPANP